MQPVYYLPLFPLHVSAVYGHHQVSLFAKTVSLRNIRNYISYNNHRVITLNYFYCTLFQICLQLYHIMAMKRLLSCYTIYSKEIKWPKSNNISVHNMLSITKRNMHDIQPELPNLTKSNFM
jgi:hypothetical protein